MLPVGSESTYRIPVGLSKFRLYRAWFCSDAVFEHHDQRRHQSGQRPIPRNGCFISVSPDCHGCTEMSVADAR